MLLFLLNNLPWLTMTTKILALLLGSDVDVPFEPVIGTTGGD